MHSLYVPLPWMALCPPISLDGKLRVRQMSPIASRPVRQCCNAPSCSRSSTDARSMICSHSTVKDSGKYSCGIDYQVLTGPSMCPCPNRTLPFSPGSMLSKGPIHGRPTLRRLQDAYAQMAVKRCFPFFLKEVKRSRDNFEAAFRPNLHSASQALYNTIQWMSIADLHETLWGKVRVFSMYLNAQEIKLRVHRAALDHENSLCFQFDDVVSLTNYTRDQACNLVKVVLLDHATNELHAIVKDTFQKVSNR